MANKVTKSRAKKAAKTAQKHPKAVIAVAIILVLVIVAVAVFWYLKPEFFHEYIGLGEHTWSEWEETAQATCTKKGERKRVCAVCGEEEHEFIDMVEHSWSEWEETAQATCTNKGERKRVCAVCGEEEHEFIDMVEHSWSEWEETAQATCTNKGERKRVCAVCGEEEIEIIPLLPHTDGDGDGLCDVCHIEITLTGSLEEIATADFSIHFLELGNKYTGDSILIDCGDVEVLIDAGSRAGSAATIKEYVDQYCDDGVLEYVIATHADQDHISGFVGTNSAKGILYEYKVGTLIQFDNVKPSKEDGALYNSFKDAVNYAKSQGANVYSASECYDELNGAKRQYYLDDAKTLSINILYNYYYYNVDKNDENNHSVVTLLTHELADRNDYYLFTGDLEGEGESEMVDWYANPANSKSEYDILPQNVVLYKAGHHGSKTSSTIKLLDVIRPEYVVVCCCAGSPEYTVNNDNTFPTQTMIDNVSKYTENVYVTTIATGLPEKDENGDFTSQSFGGYTSMNGNIVFYVINGDKLRLYCSNNNTILKDTDWFKENRTGWTTE